MFVKLDETTVVNTDKILDLTIELEGNFYVISLRYARETKYLVWRVIKENKEKALEKFNEIFNLIKGE